MSSIFGSITVETPKYTVLKTLGNSGAELRKYAPQVRAEVTYDMPEAAPIMDGLNNPFRSLAGFIFGNNSARSGAGNEKVAMTAPVVMQQPAAAASTSSSSAAASEKIAMTAPVVMQQPAAAGEQAAGSKQRVMAFIMPSKYHTPEDLPAPKDPRVRLVAVPERTFAALTFKGYMSADVAARREAELRAAAAGEGVALSADKGHVQFGAFNPPWCLPWFKTNEVLIPVAE
ncbi:hypothetical protein HYH02_010520 [Chlamydomonas schloesseri]|uniref:SOUL heme-binding protein n=1 Tax=Chlamydomonas schloesseri TaxID=2026947 RepID=A0A835TJD4_9CHLO|nr:hypothetical protein HYH02_010520 [Chlamydomonas schloesseri]|eukprot:KAG2439890.1 hypothetical protein HYH02_010520 [Chlamydomonas schloesseri]